MRDGVFLSWYRTRCREGLTAIGFDKQVFLQKVGTQKSRILKRVIWSLLYSDAVF